MVKLGVILMVKLYDTKEWRPPPKNGYQHIWVVRKKVGEIESWRWRLSTNNINGMGANNYTVSQKNVVLKSEILITFRPWQKQQTEPFLIRNEKCTIYSSPNKKVLQFFWSSGSWSDTWNTPPSVNPRPIFFGLNMLFKDCLPFSSPVWRVLQLFNHKRCNYE